MRISACVPAVIEGGLQAGFEDALRRARLTEQETKDFRLWKSRKTRTRPQLLEINAGHRVDTHVLAYSAPRRRLLRALASIQDQPTNIQIGLGGFPGSIGAARAWAFAQGSADYVTFVDDDDFAYPGVYEQAIAYLDRHPDCVGVYTDLEHETGSGIVRQTLKPWHWRVQLHSFTAILHFKLMRRSAVVKHLEELTRWPTYEEYVLCALVTQDGYWAHLPVLGARKAGNLASRSSMRLSTPGLQAKAQRRVKESLLGSPYRNHPDVRRNLQAGRLAAQLSSENGARQPGAGRRPQSGPLGAVRPELGALHREHRARSCPDA